MVSYKALNTVCKAHIPQALDGTGNADGSQAVAFIEASVAHTRYYIGYSVHDDCFRNHHFAGVFISVSSRGIPLECHTRRSVLLMKVVVNTIYFDIMPPRRDGTEEESEK